jgi:CRISPR/Cas system-associated protein Cas7 (RAMP superfamily)
MIFCLMVQSLLFHTWRQILKELTRKLTQYIIASERKINVFILKFKEYVKEKVCFSSLADCLHNYTDFDLNIYNDSSNVLSVSVLFLESDYVCGM